MKRASMLLSLVLIAPSVFAAEPPADLEGLDRSPIDLVASADESWLVTVNQTSNSASLVRTSDGVVLHEVAVGERPTAIALHPDGQRVLITGTYSGDVSVLRVDDNRLTKEATVEVGFQPYGVAVSPDGNFAYVALSAAAQVAVVDLKQLEVVERIAVARWPRYLALSPDGKRLAVGASGDRGVCIVDTEQRKQLFIEKLPGLNIGHMQISKDGGHVYFPWVVYRRNPITKGNIQLGWVLATRLARVRMDKKARRQAMSLDPRGEAITDPHGLALTNDERHLVVSASGTHELLVYRATDLPLNDYGGTDHIPRSLLNDKERFFRIPVGGRPMGLRIGKDDRTVYVANYLENSVQLVDLEDRKLVRSIPLGGPKEPSLVRRGEIIFHDGDRSLDQWYSCHTCHYEGGTNAVAMDTFNDDSQGTYKTVLPLYHVAETAPWTWHGWQNDLRAAMRKSITSTMIGSAPNDKDVDAMIAYISSIKPPPNPFRAADGTCSSAAERGKAIFLSQRANCASCHSGPYFTDGEIHDVGLGSKSDKHIGFNTPSLIGVYRKIKLLHSGKADSLEELLTDQHSPKKVSDTENFSDEEMRDLVEYLKSL